MSCSIVGVQIAQNIKYKYFWIILDTVLNIVEVPLIFSVIWYLF